MGKQYAILRVQKCKGAEVGAMQYHNDREPGKHTNPDIDQSRTRLNREMCPHADYEGEIQARIDAGYKGARKVRKDAVRLVEGIVTASPEFFEGASAEEVRDFFEDALGFCREEFGESNLVHFTVHMDEETPHAHFGFVPLRDGKLSWKGFFPDKAALGAMQDRFYGRVGALYGLSRGEKRLDGQPARRHKSVAEYKAESRRVQAELDEETRAQRVYTDKSVDIDKVRGAVDRAVVQPAEDEAARIVAAAREEAAALLNDAEARKAELVTEIADKEGDLAELDSQLEDVKLDIEDEQDRLECLRQRADGVARDVEELRPIATEVRGWEAAGKAERGAILDNIVVKCDGLASRIRAGVAGIRIKVEELRSRISRPLEYLMRSREQPRQQSLNDVLRDAQRAADAWNRDHAAPQRTYRGRAR